MSDDDFSTFRKHYAVGKGGEAEEPRSAFSRVLEVLLWLAIIGTLAGLAIPEAAGRKIEGNALLGVLGGLLLWPYLLGKVRRSPRAWLYPLVGVVSFFSVIVAAGLMRGLAMRAKGNELIAAMERFEPETGRRARAAEKDPVAMRSVLIPALTRAAARAPDAELIAFRDGMYQLVQTPDGVNRQRCKESARGGMQTKPTREEELLIARTMTRFFDAAAAHPEKFPVDPGRARATNERMMLQADPGGMLGDPARAANMTDDDACNLYLRMMRVLRKLPAEESAHVMRANMTNPDG